MSHGKAHYNPAPQSVVQTPVPSSSPGSMLEMQNPGPCARSIKPESAF